MDHLSGGEVVEENSSPGPGRSHVHLKQSLHVLIACRGIMFNV